MIHKYPSINRPDSSTLITTKYDDIDIDPSQYHLKIQCPSHKYITPTLLSMESIDRTNIEPFGKIISLKIIKPWIHEIKPMADTGANINAISLQLAHAMYKKFIQSEQRSFRVRTGGGYISCKEYIPFSIKSQGVTLHDVKFYIIPDLPTDILVGSKLLTTLGYELAQLNPTTTTSYRHQREDLDALSDEDIESNPYPVKTKTLTSTSTPKAKISNRDPELTKFIQQQLSQNAQICAQNEFDIGKIRDSEFQIEFKNGINVQPIRCKEYPHNIRNVAEIERQLQLMIKMKLISPSESPWAFPTFIVSKKNGEARIVFDYRLLNAITKRMSYSLPSIEYLMQKFKGKKYTSSIDIKSGYWHIPIRKEDRPKTAFIFNNKVYERNVMPFGPTNAPPHFQKVMDKVFAGLEYVIVYMDDITIISESPQQHQQHLKEVFKRLMEYKIKIRPDKCSFAQESVEYLGFNVNGEGITIKPIYKDKIQNIPVPKTLNQL